MDNQIAILQNKFNISDPQLLRQLERDLSALRLTELYQQPLGGNFDFEHLKDIHRYLFQDIYPWAGQIRNDDLWQQGKSQAAEVGKALDLEQVQQEIFGTLAANNFLQGLAVDPLSAMLASLFSDLNTLQPFQAGNGQTQFEFVRELARNADYQLDFTASMANPERAIEAFQLALNSDSTGLQTIIKESLVPLLILERQRPGDSQQPILSKSLVGSADQRERSQQKEWKTRCTDELLAKELLQKGFEKNRVIDALLKQVPELSSKDFPEAARLARQTVYEVARLPEIKRIFREQGKGLER